MQLNGSTARVARHRERRRNGLRVFAIEADEVLVTEKLIDAGLLHPASRDDDAAITCALQRLVKIFVLEKP